MGTLLVQSLIASLAIPKQLPGNVVFLAFLVLAGIVFGFLVGKRRIISVLLGTYIAAMILSVVPKDILGIYTYAAVGLFVVLLFVLTFFGETLFESYFGGSGPGFFLQLALMGCLIVGFLASVVLPFLPIKFVAQYISADLLGYFTSPNARLVWAVVPLAILLIIRRRG